MIAFIIGNGVSRKPIDLHQLKGEGTIFGCNALYRDFPDYDYLVSIDDFCDDMMKRNYNRNEMLVNLDLVPQHIQDDVKEQYDKYEVPEKRGLLNYFIKNRLKQLTEHIGEF